MSYLVETASKVRRREALRWIGSAAAAIILTANSSKRVDAGASPLYYQSLPDWYPLLATPSLISLHDPKGPLADYDDAYNTRVRDLFDDAANWALEQSPEARAITAGQRVDDRFTWGYCHAAAMADRDLAWLYYEGKISSEQFQQVYKDRNKRAVLAAYWAGNVQYRPNWEASKTALNNRFFLDRLNNQGIDFIGDYDIGLPGSWFHITKNYDPLNRAVLIGGFGKPDRWVSEELLRVSFEPEMYEDSIKKDRDKRMINENQSIRTPELSRQRVFEYVGIH